MAAALLFPRALTLPQCPHTGVLGNPAPPSPSSAPGHRLPRAGAVPPRSWAVPREAAAPIPSPPSPPAARSWRCLWRRSGHGDGPWQVTRGAPSAALPAGSACSAFSTSSGKGGWLCSLGSLAPLGDLFHVLHGSGFQPSPLHGEGCGHGASLPAPGPMEVTPCSWCCQEHGGLRLTLFFCLGRGA